MKRQTLLLAVFAVVMSLSASLARSDSLSGTVLDPDGSAVPNARLRLYDRKTGEIRATTASATGIYSFPGIPQGEYLVEANDSRALLTNSTQIDLAGDLKYDIPLFPTPSSATVLVTASAVPLSIREAGKAIDVISAEDLALRNELSLTEAVRSLPGIRVQTLEGPGSFTTILTRGLRPQDTAVLIDGMRFRDAASPQNDATAFLEDMLTLDTDRIEFMRGSGSSLYGSNALGGVMNIASHPGGGPPHADLRVEGGGLGMVHGAAGISGGIDNDRLTYSGKGSHLYVTRGVRRKLPYRNNSGQGTAKFSFAPRISITGRIWYSNGYLTSTESPLVNGAVIGNSADGQEVPAIPLPLDQLERYENGLPYSAGNATYIPSTIDPDGRRRGSYLSGMTAFQHELDPDTAYRVAWQSVDTRRSLFDGPAGVGPFEAFAPPRSNFDRFNDTYQPRLDRRAGEHHFLTVGYEHERERYLSYDGNDSNAASAAGIRLRQRSNAFYVQDQVRLLDGRLQLTVAARAQSFGLREPEFQGFSNPYSGSLSAIEVPTAYTGDGSIAYFIGSSQTKLRSHVGNSFRAPSGYERFGGGFGAYYGDPRLAPERAVSLDAGVDQWLFDSRAQLSATWFYTNLQQVVGFVNAFAPGSDPFGRTFGGYANRGGGIARGFELSGDFSPRTGTAIRASYTFVNSDSRMPTVSTDYYEILDVSPHVMTVTATQWVGRRTHLTFDLAAHSDYVLTLFGGGTRRFKFNGPVKPDVIVSHRLPFGAGEREAELYLKLENMFGRRLYEDGYVGSKAWLVTGFRIRY